MLSSEPTHWGTTPKWSEFPSCPVCDYEGAMEEGVLYCPNCRQERADDTDNIQSINGCIGELLKSVLINNDNKTILKAALRLVNGVECE